MFERFRQNSAPRRVISRIVLRAALLAGLHLSCAALALAPRRMRSARHHTARVALGAHHEHLGGISATRASNGLALMGLIGGNI